jgi:phage terminase large subunit-like protein
MIVVQGSTYENDALDQKTRDGFMRRFEGTADAVTELEGGLPKEAEGALWTPESIQEFRVPAIPAGVTLERIVTAVDPTRQRVGAGDLAGIMTGALGSDKHAYVYADNTLAAGPERWMDEAVAAYEINRSDYGVYEQNRLPPDYVTLLRERANRHGQHWKPVTARKQKVERAEPVAALCRSGRVHHVGYLPELEEEQCGWDPHENERQSSPNRIDAFVHLVRELLLSEQAQRKPLIVR